MSMSTDRYNKAARDGYLDALKEATRKDLNLHDEDGMTPTLWAAFEGNLDALRLIVGRGGEPDKCDNYGNTALHFAAARGHLNCVSFLSNFGVNFWSLDIDLHSPKDLAAINNKNEILCYLDAAMAKFEAKDKKKVKALKEKAEKDAAKRVKEFDKLQKKASKNLEEEQKKLEKKREKLMKSNSIDSNNKGDSNTNAITNLTNQTGFLSLRNGSIEPSSKLVGGGGGVVIGQSPKFSEIVTKSNNGHFGGGGSQKLKLPSYTGVYKKVQQRKTLSGRTNTDFTIGQIESDGKRSVRSLSGLQRDSEIMYVPKYEMSETNAGKRGKISGLFSENENNNDHYLSQEPIQENEAQKFTAHIPPHSTVSIFERPGFGSVAFRHTSSLNNFSHGSNPFATRNPEHHSLDADELEEEDEDEEEESAEFEEEEVEAYHNENNHQNNNHNNNGVIKTKPSSSHHQDGPWDDIDVPVSDNEDDGEESGAIELFLAAAGLQSYIPVFLREKMSLDTLMEQTEAQLKKNFGLETGPRRKLLNAIKDRKDAIENPGEVYDSRL